MLIDLYPQFLSIAIIHLFAVMSPGPDFALIIRQSLNYGRKISIITSIGIGTGILFHILYCVIGLGMIISKYLYVFNLIKISGALYLIYIGYKSISSKSSLKTEENILNSDTSNVDSFFTGLITNILNPKATLFFLSLYTFIINEQPSIYIQTFYGLWMSIITALWFCFLSIILTSNTIAKRVNKFTNFTQKATGFMLILIGFKLLLF